MDIIKSNLLLRDVRSVRNKLNDKNLKLITILYPYIKGCISFFIFKFNNSNRYISSLNFSRVFRQTVKKKALVYRFVCQYKWCELRLSLLVKIVRH